LTLPTLPLIGAHVSATGGLATAIDNAERIGARSIQFFGASPRMWRALMPSAKNIDTYTERLRASSVKAVYLHAAYLVNLASPDGELRAKSIKNLTEHLRIAEAVAADGLIFHIGSGKEMPKEKAMDKAVEAMRSILKDAPGQAKLVIENAAGGGQKLGATAVEVGRMLDMLKSPRGAACFDTAHAFEAGVIEKYTPANIKKLVDEWGREVGLERLVALHVNDSKTAFNSHHDRHENIGEGYIGPDGFKNLAKEKRLWDKAWILEVPGFDGTGPDRRNIETLEACFK